MSTEVKAPTFPESIEEGTVMTWYKQPGDPVAVDEKLADIETDKIVLEVAAAAAGTIEQVIKGEGDVVLSGEVIAMLGDGAGVAPPPPAREAPEPAPAKETPPEPQSRPAPPQPPASEPAVATAPPAAAPPAKEETMFQQNIAPGISPSARKLIQEKGIDPGLVQGSGRQGRVTKADVIAFIEANEPTGASPAGYPQPPADEPPPAGAAPIQQGEVERKPMSRIRARIAQRLVEAQQTAAILTTFNELNMKPVIDLRNRYKEEFEKKHGVRLGFMSFFVKATVEALKQFPEVNASIDGNDILYHRLYNIGVAVSSPRGLVVPVVRDADQMGFHEIEHAIRGLGQKAQDNQLQIEELQGGTFTISNGGVFGSMLSTPILNPPQSGILGMHTITERPVVENGEIVIRPMMHLALSYDHRIIDGRGAVLFLVTIKEMLEDPSRMLLQV